MNGRTRFLSVVFGRSLEQGFCAPELFLRAFSPATMMDSLKEQADLRADIISKTIGTLRLVALRQTPASGADDLEIALDVEATDVKTIIGCLTPERWAEHLDNAKLWALLTQRRFWEEPGDEAKRHVAFILEGALKNELVSQLDIIRALTIEKVLERMTRDDLVKMLQDAVDRPHQPGARPFDERDLLANTPPEALVNQFPLPVIWDGIIKPALNGGDSSPKADAASDTPAIAEGQDAAPPLDADNHPRTTVPQVWKDGPEPPSIPPTASPPAITAASEPEETDEEEEGEHINLLVDDEDSDQEKSERKSEGLLERLHPHASTLEGLGSLPNTPSPPKAGGSRASSVSEMAIKIRIQRELADIGIEMDDQLINSYALKDLQILIKLLETHEWPPDEDPDLRDAMIAFVTFAEPWRFKKEDLRFDEHQALRIKFLSAVRGKSKSRELFLALTQTMDRSQKAAL